ncbi:serine hydrolase [marine bacterium AO1-C]|nr:serine hydrolase [marine bacterium AO1-C]
MKYISFITLCLIAFATQAQIDENSELFKTLAIEDSTFFERSFNRCDFDYLDKHIASDLRFYHDQAGMVDRAAFFKSIKENICSNPDKKPIRRLEPGSLSVFPLHNNGKLYGAIQNGVHHFYIREKDKPDVWTSTAKFTSVWIKEEGVWKMSEVLSFDHQSSTPPGGKKITGIEALLKECKVPALGLGIIKDGKLTRVETYGTLDGQTTTPYNAIFKVASLTKPIFAITVLKLIDQGKVKLDERLYKYWIDPEIAKDKRHKKLTPRLVLSHQTGFPNWRYLTKDKKLTFQFDPGTKYQYSGEGFEYLRKAIEQKLGKSLEELAKEVLFTPVGMTDTRFWWDKTMDESRYAQNFDVKGKKIPTEKYYKANAAANLLTTVGDYGKFVAYVTNGAGLSKSLLQEMQKSQIKIKPNNHFGLGWELLTNLSKGEYAMVHSGKDPGVSTLAVIFPKSKNGYVIFLNGDNIFKIYEHLLKHRLYLGNDLWDRK